MSSYDFEVQRILDEIKKSKAELVGLQFPEGLKQYAVEIANEIEKKTNAKVVIFIGPTYGACDLKLDTGKKLKLDMIIHFGHNKFNP
ncbi:MAG: diphthamide synthesis protein [Candidatus Altiarchaeota archaeon]